MTARRPSTAEWLRGLVGARTGLALGLLLGALVAPPWALSTSAPTPEDRCGAIGMDAPYEIVQLASASDIWLEFPAFRRAPALENDAAPATLVVFPRGYDLGRMVHGNGQAPTDAGLVACVIEADGRMLLYPNVPTQGSRFAR